MRISDEKVMLAIIEEYAGGFLETISYWDCHAIDGTFYLVF
jgi:hypothetical protein